MKRSLEKPSNNLVGKRSLPNKVLDQIEEAAGGRVALLEALAHAPESEAQQRLMGLLADPRMDTSNLGRVCAVADMTVGEVLSLLKQGKHTRALIAAMDRVNAYLPDVAEDLMARAVPHVAPCTECVGSGHLLDQVPDEKQPGKMLEVQRKCMVCRGSGKVPVVPELARQKVALELGGLLKKESGTTVVVNQNQGLFAFGADVRKDYRGRTDEILYGRGQAGAVDAEVVDGGGEGPGADAVGPAGAGADAEAQDAD